MKETYGFSALLLLPAAASRNNSGISACTERRQFID
jgi:hypothetical protein